MNYHDYIDLTMDWVFEALRNVPESPAPHLDLSEDELLEQWRSLGKARDGHE